MKKERYIDWPYFIGLMFVPVIVVVILFLYTKIDEINRYDEAFFTEEYAEVYHSPGMVAIDLEVALRDGDVALMNELVGTRRRIASLEPRPDLILVFLIDSDETYYHFLLFDKSNYNRVLQYVKEENGRYIAAKRDLFFLMDSGQWKLTATPLAVAWWSLVLVVTFSIYVYRRMRVVRRDLYDR